MASRNFVARQKSQTTPYMLPDFRLLPWEFVGSGCSLPAHAHLVALFEGEEREFLLKVHEDRLFFREVEADSPVYAVTQPYSGEDIEQFWRLAIQRGNHGRFLFRRPSFEGGAMDTMMIAIVMGEECGWIREWCGGEWLFFSVRDIYLSLLRGITATDFRLAHFVGRAIHEKTQVLRERVQPPAERQSQPTRWLRGSRREAGQVAQACVILFGNMEYWRKFQDIYTTVTPDSPLIGGDFRCNLLPHFWNELLSEHFVAVGWYWRRCPKIDKSLRGGWKPVVPFQRLGITPVENPTLHEQMEATLLLRDWLRGKIPDSRIEELLSEARSLS